MRRSEGASAVEFVFILPVLVGLVFGIIQFGIAYNRSQGMHASAREGARLASVGADVDDIGDRVEASLNGTTVTSTDVDVHVYRFEESVDPSVEVDPKKDALKSGDVPCDGSSEAYTVRVDAEVKGALASEYAITIPGIPSMAQTFPATAIFRCEDRP